MPDAEIDSTHCGEQTKRGLCTRQPEHPGSHCPRGDLHDRREQPLGADHPRTRPGASTGGEPS